MAESLGRFSARAEVCLGAFQAQLDRAHRHAAGELAARRPELAAAVQALANADERSAPAHRARVARAEAAVDAASRALAVVDDECRRARRAIGRYLAELRGIAAASAAEARAIEAEIDAYAVAARPEAPVPAGEPAAGVSGGRTGGVASALQTHGLELVDVDAPDYRDNPAVGPSHVPEADVRWAVDRWDTQVSHQVGRGATHDDLEALDRASGASGHRRLAGVWDTFIADPIVLDEDDAGRLTVVSGRHRLEAARQLGVARLPARIRRRRR
jgi:hypothetical protein